MSDQSDSDYDQDVVPDFMKPASLAPGTPAISTAQGTTNGDELYLPAGGTQNQTMTTTVPDYMVQSGGSSPRVDVSPFQLPTDNSVESGTLPQGGDADGTLNLGNGISISTPAGQTTQEAGGHGAKSGSPDQGMTNFMTAQQRPNVWISGDGAGDGQVMTAKVPDYMVQSGGSSPKINVAPLQSQTANNVQGGVVTPANGEGTTYNSGDGLSISSSQGNASGANVTLTPVPGNTPVFSGTNAAAPILSGGMSPRVAQQQWGNDARGGAGGNQADSNRNRTWKSMVPTVQKQNEQKDAAQLSAASYSDDGGVSENQVPSNYEMVAPDELIKMGLDPRQFSSADNDLHSFLYRNKTNGRYVLAFRGTDSVKDWETDLEQGFGFDAGQYDQAIRLARAVDGATRKAGSYVSFTGHSLGGGLAAAAALATSRPANTFNAAAVSNETLQRNQVDTSPGADKILINSFYVPGEALSDVQGASAHGLGTAIWVGTAGLLDPVGVAQGRRIRLDPPTSTEETVKDAAGMAIPPYGAYRAAEKHMIGKVLAAMQ